jgi:hypothetical protein
MEESRGEKHNKRNLRDFSALPTVSQQSGGLPMSRSDEYRRFAAECLKMPRTAEDEQNRAMFLQMAQAWFALAQKDESNADRNGGPED